MKKILLILTLIIVAFGNSECYGKIKESSVDSILVKYITWDLFTPVTIGREYFESHWKAEGKQTQIIKEDSSKILITYLNLLKFKKNLRINTNELLLNSNITPDGKSLFWIGKDNNDIRVQLVIYNKSGEKEIIWIGYFFTDIGRERYETSQELIDFITKLFEPSKI
ncbi:MAG: hypothetical protein PHR45_04190 [Muribaculaceae bacterium]|nr:hypothetical protein [Muribaculaceae bacterium]